MTQVTVLPGNVIKVTVSKAGNPGPSGNNGWSPIFSIVSDGDRQVLRVSGWAGGAGTEPASGSYVGSSGFVTDIASAQSVRGGDGLAGPQGWSPALSLISDNERRVLQLTDWVGGVGAKPSVGDYIGTTGLVAAIASAVNIRGAVGASGNGTGDMSKSEYDTNDSGSVDSAEAAPWAGLTGVPTEFNPIDHDHDIADITNLQGILDGKANTSEVYDGTYASLTGVPTEFAPSAHNQNISTINGLQAELDAKALASAVFDGDYSSLSNIPTEFNPSSHNHAIADITNLQAALDGAQGGGLVPISKETIGAATSAVDIDLVGFKGYWIWLHNITASASLNMRMRLSDDAGASFGLTGYKWSSSRVNVGVAGAPAYLGSANDSQITMNINGVAAQQSGWIRILDAANTGAQALLSGSFGNPTYSCDFMAAKTSPFAPNAMRLFPQSGTFSGGEIHVFGIAEGA